MKPCNSIGCHVHLSSDSLLDFCSSCIAANTSPPTEQLSMSELYPKYYKDFTGIDEADVYIVHDRFEITDHSGCIHHASKKLLLSGVRTGGKSKYDDVREARDTLNRWLEINKDR
jgi:hypothetical protein